MSSRSNFRVLSPNAKGYTMRYVSIVLLLSNFLLSSRIFAAEYYVAPRATQALNEADEGESAWATATDKLAPCSAGTAMVHAVAGDMVYFRGGIYELGQSNNNQSGAGVLYPRNSGMSDTNRIVFSAYPEESPVLNTNVDGEIISRAWGDRGQDYTTLRGFTISSTGETYCGSVGVGDNSIGTIIENCAFLGSSIPGTNTDNISGVAFGGGSAYGIVRNCSFQDYRDSSDNHNTSAIKTYYAHYMTVTNCEFRNCTVAIYNKQDSDYNIYQNNFSYDCTEHVLVSVANTGDSTDGIIRNNVMVDASYAAILLEQSNSNYTHNWVIANNTIYNSSPTPRCISINDGTGRYIYNNIIVADAGECEIRYINGSTVNEEDHNLIYAPSLSLRKDDQYYTTLASWQSSGVLIDGGNPGSGDLDSNPQFNNSSDSFSHIQDFSLSESSPAKGGGRNGMDMGADISVVGISNLPSPQILDTTPAAPVNLRIAK